MFLFQHKYEWRLRVIALRNEWGELHKIAIKRGTEIPMNDRELQEQLQTTAIIKRTD